MKVLLLNGSPHEDGCTATALREVASTLECQGVETEIVHVGRQALHGVHCLRALQGPARALCV